MTAEQAIHSFWSSFEVAAYDENSVPETAQLPYITYSLSYDSFDNNVTMNASIWDRSTSWQYVTQKAHDIYDYIGYGGKIIPTSNGGIWIKRGNPFYQRVGEDEKNIKRIYLNITAEYFDL